MTVDERLAQIWPKVERAKNHISDLEREIQKFLATNPYKVGTKRDPQSRKLIYYVSGVAQTSVNIPLIAGDAVQNLMSALDHLAYQLVCASTNDIPPNPKWIFFPVADNAEKYEAKKAGKIQGARQDIFDAIDLIKPYKGGNDLLWVLYRLNSIEKHRLLITVGSMFQSVNIGAHMHTLMQESFGHMWPGLKTMPMLDLFMRPADTMFPLKVGDELFIDAVDAEVNEKMQFRFNVALSEPQIIEAKSLIETLHQMANLVEGIVTTLQTKLG
jgi:hypothetical protein